MPRCIDCRFGERCVESEYDEAYVVYYCHATNEYINEAAGDNDELGCDFYDEDSYDDTAA